MAFEPTPLPYPHFALSSVIAAETLNFHYGKHHAAYVNNLTQLTEGSTFENVTLEGIIRDTQSDPMFNNAAQVWNHTFYRDGMTPERGARLEKSLGDAVDATFGSLSGLESGFLRMATGNFGSGWTWLVRAPNGRLAVENTSNAETPLLTGAYPLLVCDVWEHAYHIDFRNARPRYVEQWWSLVDWEYAGRCTDF